MNEYKFEDLEELAQKQAAMCKIFSSTRRVLIVWVLGRDEMTVTEIAHAVGASLQGTSQHLRLMKDKGVLTSRKDGQTVLYRISENALIQNCLILERSPLSEKTKLNDEPLGSKTFIKKE